MSARQVEWILASSNTGKLAEFSKLLEPLSISLQALAASGIESPEETGTTFVENAIIKARHAARTADRPAIADDSGLCVDALGYAPGVISARFAGADASDSDNIRRLLDELAGVPGEKRQASFHCVIVALRSADDPAPVIASGRWPGIIATEPRGNHGFGYDPVFIDPDLGLTAAELPPERKNTISHRGRASMELIRRLTGEP